MSFDDFQIFFPKDIFFGSVWALSVGVCEMWSTWMCLPVAVPGNLRILAGRRFLRFCPDFCPDFYPNFCPHFCPPTCCGFSFPIWKSIIGRFSNRKWPCMSSGRVFLIWISSSGRFSNSKWTGGGDLDANDNFPIRISPDFSPDRVVRVFRGSDFIYTKNSAIGRSDFIYTKNSARLRYDFIYAKSFLRKIVKNQWYSQKFSALRAPTC